MATANTIVGQKAPDFSLLNQDDTTVKLDDWQGQWLVLYFYPRDNTPGCTTEACEFTESIKRFESLDARVIGVSPDSTASHRKFIEKHDLKIELLSDPDHEVLEAYGAWGEKNMYGKKYMGVVRTTVLIDPEGCVAAYWPKVRVAGHVQAVQEKVKELKSNS